MEKVWINYLKFYYSIQRRVFAQASSMPVSKLVTDISYARMNTHSYRRVCIYN